MKRRVAQQSQFLIPVKARGGEWVNTSHKVCALNSGALKELYKASRNPVSSTWKAPSHSLVPTAASQACWLVEESCHSFLGWNTTSPLSFPILRPVSTPCDKSKQATGELPSCLVDDSFCQIPRLLPASLLLKTGECWDTISLSGSNSDLPGKLYFPLWSYIWGLYREGFDMYIRGWNKVEK